MNSFITTLIAKADSHRADCARKADLIKLYGFEETDSSGTGKDGSLTHNAKTRSTVELPDGDAGKDLVKEWKALCRRISTRQKFFSQDGGSYGQLRQLCELVVAQAAQLDALTKGSTPAVAPAKKAA